VSVLRSLSFFVSKPLNIYHLGSLRNIPLQIKPDPNFYINSNVGIFILCDASTACASEIFIQCLKMTGRRVTVVGATPTSGQIANRFDIHLPSGTILYTNSLTGKIFFPDDKSVESTGIYPDILIPLEKVRDLRPFNDKVLYETTRLINTR